MDAASDAHESAKVRVDKWLQIARAFRTRSKATQACQGGKVRINGETAKPHQAVSLDQRIEIDQGQGWTRVLIVRKIFNRSVAKALAATMYEDLSPPRPRVDPLGHAFRSRGQGRPSKRERRELERLRHRR